MKDLCQKWNVKLIFRDAYRLSGTGIVECLEIIDVGCNTVIWKRASQGFFTAGQDRRAKVREREWGPWGGGSNSLPTSPDRR